MVKAKTCVAIGYFPSILLILVPRYSESQGFFQIYRNLFDRLAKEENEHAGHDLDYPSFGDATWPWTTPKKRDGVQNARSFYGVWLHFDTAKEFEWKEMWNTAEAPDRRIRRHAPLYFSLSFFLFSSALG